MSVPPLYKPIQDRHEQDRHKQDKRNKDKRKRARQKRTGIICLLLFLAALFFILSKSGGKNLPQGGAGQPGVNGSGHQRPRPYSRPGESAGKQKSRKSESIQPPKTRQSSSSHRYSDQIMPGEDSAVFNPALSSLSISGSTLEIGLSDIADYDAFSSSYTLKKIDLFADREYVPSDLLAALKILNRKNMPPDYFRWQEYESAYNEIDALCPDYYVWPYFTNREARVNFFLFLFSRYAADNKNWRPYEKNVSDCSQFSQRIYLLMHSGEVYTEDEQYFRFLFSDSKTREERKKLCNKIPNILYTTLTPYSLKKDRFDPPATGHAMISFTADNSRAILAEPQTGAFENFGENIGNVLDEQLTQSPLICRLGEILSIQGDKRHEANIKEARIYFIPQTSHHDPTREEDRDYEPVLLQDQTYRLFQVISSYLESVLSYQPVDRMVFLRSLENFSPLPEGGTSVDMIMYGLLDLEDTDLSSVRAEMKDLQDFADGQPSLPQRVKDFVTRLNYLFMLKLEALFEG